MLRLLLARHGQTAANAQGRIQGREDVPLDDRGRDQARLLGASLDGEGIDVILASPLRRAWETATLVGAELGHAPRSEPRMVESCYGVWEGLDWPEVRARYPDEWRAWNKSRDRPPPGGEPRARVAERVEQALSQLRRDHAGQTVLVVAHGGSLRIMVCLAFGIDLSLNERLALDNTGVSELHLRPEGVVLRRFNDTGHLKRGS